MSAQQACTIQVGEPAEDEESAARKISSPVNLPLIRRAIITTFATPMLKLESYLKYTSTHI